MPVLKISLKDKDDATSPDCWKLYHVHLGHYIGLPQSSKGCVQALEWAIHLNSMEYNEFLETRTAMFDAIFNVVVV